MKFFNKKSLALCGFALAIGVTAASPARADWDRDRYEPRPHYGYVEQHRYRHRGPPPVYYYQPQPRVVYMAPPPVYYAQPSPYPYGINLAFNIR